MAPLTLQLTCIAALTVGHARPSAIPGLAIPRSAAVPPGLQISTNDTTILTATAGVPAIVTLDYGHSIEGIPTFEVVSVEGDTSVFEITYAESSTALSSYMVRLNNSDL